MYADALDHLLADCMTEAAIRGVEAAGTNPQLWHALESAGFNDLLRKEASGGPGLSLAETFELFLVLGRRMVPLPLASTWVARRVLPTLNELPGGIAVARGVLDGQGRITCPHVAGGRCSAHVLVHLGHQLRLLPVAAHQMPSSVGDPRGLACRLEWDPPQALWASETGGVAVQSWMAAATAGQIAGILSRILAMTLEHCNQRQQFGKPIGQFQAVQHQLSVMAEQVLAATMAAELALASGDDSPHPLNAAIAKARASEACTQVCSTAHALHGAIGMTDEYLLGLCTRRAQQWRLDHGSEVHWQRLIGEALLDDTRSVAEVIAAL